MPDLLKVLHVVTSLDPGGMENGVVNMARALEPRGIQMDIACLERKGAFAERLPASAQIEVLGKTNGFSWGAVSQLARKLSRSRPQIIHTHNLGPLIYSGLATAFGWRCALVHGEHSQLTPEERQPRRVRQRRCLYRACRAVHTVSHGIRRELLALHFPAEQISVVTNGVDTDHFRPGERPAARATLGLPRDGTFIGIVGRFGPFKRHERLVEAFEIIAARNAELRLLIAGGGGGEEARVTDRARRSQFADRIHFTGFRPDPLPCYQALDLLAIPSVNEGLSNAALEAMACGVPVLGNIDCGHEEIISDQVDGVIADLGTSEGLESQITSLLARPSLLIDFGRRARQTVEARFSLKTMADAYERVYRNVAPPAFQ